MDEKITKALKTDKTIDITTIGRTSGEPRRIEIWFHNVEDVIYISGLPGKRSWLANLLANPDFTFHLKGSLQANLAAQATPITDLSQRREIMSKFDGDHDLDAWVADSPLVRVTFK